MSSVIKKTKATTELPKKVKSSTKTIDVLPTIFSHFRICLCNYSVRQCAMYLVIFDIVLLFVTFIIVGYSYSYIHVNVMMRQSVNDTVYEIVANSEILIRIDISNKNSVIDMLDVIKKMLIGMICYLIIDLVIDIMGLMGILWDQSKYVVPYIISLAITIIWIAMVVIVDIILYILKIHSSTLLLPWVFVILFEFQKCYKFVILYSYVFYNNAYRNNIEDDNFSDDVSKHPSPVRIVRRPGQGPRSIALEPIVS